MPSSMKYEYLRTPKLLENNFLWNNSLFHKQLIIEVFKNKYSSMAYQSVFAY